MCIRNLKEESEKKMEYFVRRFFPNKDKLIKYIIDWHIEL